MILERLNRTAHVLCKRYEGDSNRINQVLTEYSSGEQCTKEEVHAFVTNLIKFTYGRGLSLTVSTEEQTDEAMNLCVHSVVGSRTLRVTVTCNSEDGSNAMFILADPLAKPEKICFGPLNEQMEAREALLRWCTIVMDVEASSRSLYEKRSAVTT